jgi:hypothetical protein
METVAKRDVGRGKNPVAETEKRNASCEEVIKEWLSFRLYELVIMTSWWSTWSLENRYLRTHDGDHSVVIPDWSASKTIPRTTSPVSRPSPSGTITMAFAPQVALNRCDP